jgi:hypothetical protein
MRPEEITMKRLSCVFAILTILLTAAGRTTSAQNALTFSKGPHVIIARHSGMSIDVQNAGGEMALLQTAGLGGQPNREFLIRPTSGGFFTIAARHSGLTLDVRGAATKPVHVVNYGDIYPVVQTAGHGGQANREFAIKDVGGHFYTITAKHSGLSLDVMNARGEGAFIQTAGNGGQPNREWLIVPVGAIASHAYRREPRPMSPVNIEFLQKVAAARSLAVDISAPISSRETGGLTLSVSNITFHNLKMTLVPRPELSAKLTAAIQPFVVVYATDQIGPEYPTDPVKYGRIIYPVDLAVMATETTVTGSFRATMDSVEGEFAISTRGLVGVGTPKSKGIPVRRGDNDGPEGPPGWEYKTWNNIADGVRQPRRDDIKGWPEIGRGNIGLVGDVNVYLFAKPKTHEFRGDVKLRVSGSHVDVLESSVKLIHGFQKGRDYVIDASGLFAGPIQDAVEGKIIKTISDISLTTFRFKGGQVVP